MAADAAPEKGKWLKHSTEAFEAVRQSLEIALPLEWSVKELEVWEIEGLPDIPPILGSQLTLECFVHSGELGGSNALFDVCARGFAVPDGGLEFTHGALGAGAVSRLGSETLCVLCDVVVGRSAVLEDETGGGPAALPSGYDSVYLPRDGAEGAAGRAPADGAGAAYEHTYVVFESRRVRPKYVAHFVAGAGGAGAAGDEPGDSLDRLEFFDRALNAPVSVRDKMTGSHSFGDKATHALVSLDDAYDEAVDAAAALGEDAALGSRRASVVDRLALVDAKLREVNVNFADCEEKIYASLQRALLELQEKTRDRVSSLLSVELELRRQLGELDAGAARLRRNATLAAHTAGDKARFVRSLGAYKKSAEKLKVGDDAASSLGAIRGVKPDLHVVGGVSVVGDDEVGGLDGIAKLPRKHVADDGTRAPGTRAARLGGSGSASALKRPDEFALLVRKYKAHSLKALADRKRKQLAVAVEANDVFSVSTLARGGDGASLYLALPFTTSPPATRLLYTSTANGRDVPDILRALADAPPSPTVFVARAGEFVFGAYVSETFKTDGAPFGSPRAFLFSLTLDLKLPYHGATALASALEGAKVKKHGSITATDAKISFGASDFVIDESLSTCASTLEGSFGVGLDDDAAASLLAGAATFAVDHLEIWSATS